MRRNAGTPTSAREQPGGREHWNTVFEHNQTLAAAIHILLLRGGTCWLTATLYSVRSNLNLREKYPDVSADAVELLMWLSAVPRSPAFMGNVDFTCGCFRKGDAEWVMVSIWLNEDAPAEMPFVCFHSSVAEGLWRERQCEMILNEHRLDVIEEWLDELQDSGPWTICNTMVVVGAFHPDTDDVIRDALLNAGRRDGWLLN